MCHALLCVKEIHQLMTGRGFRVATSPVVNVNQHFTKMSKIIKKVVFPWKKRRNLLATVSISITFIVYTCILNSQRPCSEEKALQAYHNVVSIC
jgi:hypothetical protein